LGSFAQAAVIFTSGRTGRRQIHSFRAWHPEPNNNTITLLHFPEMMTVAPERGGAPVPSITVTFEFYLFCNVDRSRPELYNPNREPR
jgi:hypothetical protein